MIKKVIIFGVKRKKEKRGSQKEEKKKRKSSSISRIKKNKNPIRGKKEERKRLIKG